MKAGLISVAAAAALAACCLGGIEGPTPFESVTSPTAATELDQLVFDKLRARGIQPANVCSDATFLRRVYLDTIGTLPTPEEVQAFLGDNMPDKRSELIDRLLQRPEFADYWALKWSDLLRVKSEFPINLWPNAVQGYHRWIRTSIAQNQPYDRFVREMLTASGSNFRVPPVNFYRAMQDKTPEGAARAVALTFMGTRAEKWPTERLAGMAGFFSQLGYKKTGEWKEEIVFFDPARAATSGTAFPDGRPVSIAPGTDGREVFANWLITPENPWFGPVVVNRIWSWLVGRGITHEPDAFGPENPPTNPALLQLLHRQLVAARYDLKHIYRLILNSRTYQLSSIPRSDHPEATAHFAHYPVRRLEAEVLIDALNQITGSTEKYTSPIPEPFTFIPEDQRSIALADGSITSTFLEMFGRSARDTGLESERSNQPSMSQRLHLLNSSHIQRKITQAQRLQKLFRPGAPVRTGITDLYITILSRPPDDTELKVAQAYIATMEGKESEAAVDLVWALINTSEFLYRH